jgi:hypothetical protein
MSVSQSKCSVRQDTLTTDGHIDAVDLDILALVGAATQLERVDSHVELLVRLRRVGLIQKPGSLILDVLELLLALLGSNLALGLLQFLAVDLGLDLALVGRL